MVKEKLAAIGKPLRKFASTPNLAAAVRSNLFLFCPSFFSFSFLRQFDWSFVLAAVATYKPSNKEFLVAVKTLRRIGQLMQCAQFTLDIEVKMKSTLLVVFRRTLSLRC